MLELKTYKNYRELCKVMNWSTTGGNTKTKYLKELDSLCKWHKEGNKIVIDEIYSEPKKIVDNRYGEEEFIQLKVSKEDWHKSGVYKIQFENKIYIGSTKDFRKRYKQHIYYDEQFSHIWELLKEDNHVFEVLEVVEDMEELKKREQYYIELYSKDSNCIVVNKQCAHKEKILKKHETKNIKVPKEDYEKAIEILKREGIEII